MQRIALNRARAFARVTVVIGIIWVILAFANVFSSANLFLHLSQLALGFAFLVTGILRLLQSRKRLREFEEENGPGAGEQKPVR